MTVVPANDGCPWPVDTACLTDEWEADYDEPTKTRAIALASNTLHRLTAYRVGGCPVKIRPCAPQSSYRRSYRDGEPFYPVNWGGSWSNQWCSCDGPCRHQPGVAILLPRPVIQINQVKVDGAVVLATNYWLSDGYLIGLNGQTWPRTQNLDLPDTQAGTFSVTYLDTYPVDGQGAYVAAKLAIQFARACKNGKCDLPATVTGVVRQGVSYTVPTGAFEQGRTGIKEVDAYIALWNPQHRQQPIQAWSP